MRCGGWRTVVGPSALYKGFNPIFVRKVVWCSVFFVTYEQLRAAINREGGAE